MRTLTILAVFALTACGKSDEQKQVEAAAAQLEQSTKEMAEAMKTGGANIAGAAAALGNAMGNAMGAGKAAEAVDFRELKALLPEDLPELKRTNAEGQKSSAMGFTISTAEARYQSESGPSMTITISDVGAMTGVGAMAAYAWAAAEIDSESETGYERTGTIKGYRGHEKYDKQSRSGEVSIMVAGRFVVEVEGNDVTMDALKAALDKMDLRKLESMKNVGVK